MSHLEGKVAAHLGITPPELMLTNGLDEAIHLLCETYLEPGDEVLYPDPGFPIYPSFTRGLGATAVPFGLVEKNKFQPELSEIASKITTDIGGKLSKMETELDSLKVALEKAEQKPTRSSPREKVIAKTKITTTNQKAQIVAQQQKIERKQAGGQHQHAGRN